MKPKSEDNIFFKIGNSKAIVGKGKNCDVNLDSKTVDSRHASINSKLNKFYLEDCDSSYGTYVKVEKILNLEKNDTFEIEKYIFIKVIDIQNEILKLDLDNKVIDFNFTNFSSYLFDYRRFLVFNIGLKEEMNNSIKLENCVKISKISDHFFLEKLIANDK